MKYFKLILILCLFFIFSCSSQKKQKPLVGISFHLETEKTSNFDRSFVFTLKNNGKTQFFERSAIITKKGIIAFAPFPGENNDYGGIFQLSPQYAKRLKAISTANIGKEILLKLNGKNIDSVIIDKPSKAPYIAIWKNLSLKDIQLLKKTFPNLKSLNHK